MKRENENEKGSQSRIVGETNVGTTARDRMTEGRSILTK